MITTYNMGRGYKEAIPRWNIKMPLSVRSTQRNANWNKEKTLFIHLTGKFESVTAAKFEGMGKRETQIYCQ